MAAPSPGYSITVRVEAPASSRATGELTAAIGVAGGALTALDVAESRHDSIVVDGSR
jgi:malate dehydrogenase (oxaloacetate-decarboxylating)